MQMGMAAFVTQRNELDSRYHLLQTRPRLALGYRVPALFLSLTVFYSFKNLNCSFWFNDHVTFYSLSMNFLPWVSLNHRDFSN